MTEKARNMEAISSLISVEGGNRKTRTEKIVLKSELDKGRSNQNSKGEGETARAGKIFQVEFGQDDKNERIDTERLIEDTGELERKQRAYKEWIKRSLGKGLT